MIGQIDKTKLHALVDKLPECELESVYQALLERLAEHDPLLRVLLNAPEDDEPLSEEDRAAIDEAMESIARGEPAIPHEELMRELGL